MRTSLTVMLAILLGGSGCTGDGTTAVQLVPAIALLDGAPVESRIAAQLLPSSLTVAGDGELSYEVRVTNGLAETVSSGLCAPRVDARPVDGRQWVNATPDLITCPSILATFPQGEPRSIYAAVNNSVLRRLVGRPGKRVVLRVRHVVGGGTTSYLVQSAEQEIVVP